MKNLAIILFLLTPCAVFAHVPSFDECLEASQFISHASMSRDNGYPWETFAQQMENDINYLQSIPENLRWFVVDKDDGQYLYGWAETAFNNKKTPDENATDFLNSCLKRMNPEPKP